MTFVASDEAARESARRDHKTSFVLEAGAGTGKTTLLVDRIESLVRTGRASLLEIAAVTFTEFAAATMKLRLRERLESVRASPSTPDVERERTSAALEVLERAQVSTIHALCAAMLQERPLESGVVPGFRVADEAETDALFAAAWDEWLAERLDAGDPALVAAVRAEIPLESDFEYADKRSLRGLARTLLEQRDLAPIVAEAPIDPEAWLRELLGQVARLRTLIATVRDKDTLKPRLEAVIAHAERARVMRGAELARHLAGLPRITPRIGQHPNWPSIEALEEGRQLAWSLGEMASKWTLALGADLHARLVKTLMGVVERYQAKKTERGVLDFLDLLLKARDALSSSDSVRRFFASRFRYVLIDEFQDTDPLQVEIAALLTGKKSGRLVVVGDAKQSIYRFRRAEVALLRRLSEDARSREGHAVLQLTQNFRSRPAIIRFVNRVFSSLIQPSEESDQPAYVPIEPRPDLEDTPSVVALSFPAPTFAEARDDLLQAEARAVAAFISSVARGGRTVRDPSTLAARASSGGDVMVLAPRLTQVRFLEEALWDSGIPFAVEGGKSFFGRLEVHEVISVLRALDDPSDRVALVAALRSRFFGLSDAEIVGHVLGGGRLSLTTPVEGATPLLGRALSVLQRLHAERLKLSLPALIERLYEETLIFASLTGSRRGEAEIRNLEKVTALARQASSLTILTLRAFTRLLEERANGAGEEPDLPSARPSDPETVRILSIHKAKGLEAPIVILYDQAASLQTRADVIPLFEEKKIAVGFIEGFRPPGWKELQDRDRSRAWAEGRRLLYVATTRARDLLVVPRPPEDTRPGSFWRDLWPFLDRSPPSDVISLDASTLERPPLPQVEVADVALQTAEGRDAVAERWQEEREGLLRRASERPFKPIAATSLAAKKAPPSQAVLPGGGRSFGRLVHRVLEWLPLDALGDKAALASRMAAALGPSYGVSEEEAGRAGEHLSRALSLPVMDRARRASHVWREVPLWFPEDGLLVEGVVDLVFEEDGELVVVDYKTDHVADADVLAQAAHHAAQLQLYGRGLTQATGLKVAERLLLFTAVGRVVAV